MNEHDRSNYNFLLNISQESFDAWLDQASSDDIDYALEIIKKGRTEATVELMELEDIMYTYDDDMKEAKEVIERIKNLGK
jgi:hypothetical protein